MCPASSSIASSAATAAFRGPSRCPNRSTSSACRADLKDGILTVTIPKAVERGAPNRCNLRRCQHVQRISPYPARCSSRGSVAGLVVTGRMRTATESRAESRPLSANTQLPPTRSAPVPQPDTDRCTGFHARSPDRRSRASPTSRRCRSSAGATRRSPTIRSSATSSATRRVLRIARSAIAQPRVRRDHLRRRLRRHQQPRGRRERARHDHRRAARQARDQGAGSSASIRPPTSRC